MTTEDPLFQLSNSGKNPAQTGNEPEMTEQQPTNHLEGESTASSTENTASHPNPFAMQGNDSHNQNHPIDEESLGFFTASASAETKSDKLGLHEDEHSHDDDDELETQNEHSKNAEDDPLAQLQVAGGATGGDSSKGGFLNFESTSSASSSASSTQGNTPSMGNGFTSGQSMGNFQAQNSGFGNQSGMGFGGNSNMGSPLGQDARQYTANRYMSHQQNLANSQGFMGQFQQNVNMLQGNNGGGGGWDLPINMLVGDISYMEALGNKLFFKEDRKKASEEEYEEIKKKLKKIKEKIGKDQHDYRRWENVSKRWAFVFKFLSSALAAVVTVLLGINITDTLRSWSLDWWINFFALLISAFISLIGVFQQFFDSDKLWVKYTDTANKLQQLLSLIEYAELSDEYLTLEDVDAINVEYFRIIESTHNYELLIRAKNDETSNQITHQGIMHQNGMGMNRNMGMGMNQGMGMNRNMGMGMNQGLGMNSTQGGFNSGYNSPRRF